MGRRGRVLPLLSVASAFHPELNGRENVELFGTILGLGRDEIVAATPEVAAFSGIDREHLATPTKRFSEGMQARLAFAIALRLPADVYIFDEVLAVHTQALRGAFADGGTEIRTEGDALFVVFQSAPKAVRAAAASAAGSSAPGRSCTGSSGTPHACRSSARCTA